MKLTTATFIFTSFFASSAVASSLDINLHSDAARATYAFYSAPKTVADFGVLSTKKFNERETALHAGVNFVFENLRFGMRMLHATPGTIDVLALGFGAQGRFALNSRVGVGGHFYHAPESTSFMDSGGYNELAARIDFKMAKGAYVYAGYRNLKVKMENSNSKIEYDDDIHVGLKFYF